MVLRVTQCAEEPFAYLLQAVLGALQQPEQSVQALVDGMFPGFDQAVGVEDEQIALLQLEGRGFEGNTADPERDSGGQIEQFRGRPARTRTGGMCPAVAMWHSAR